MPNILSAQPHEALPVLEIVDTQLLMLRSLHHCGQPAAIGTEVVTNDSLRFDGQWLRYRARAKHHQRYDLCVRTGRVDESSSRSDGILRSAGSLTTNTVDQRDSAPNEAKPSIVWRSPKLPIQRQIDDVSSVHHPEIRSLHGQSG